MDPEQYRYYCDLRRYGTCHHAGFGLGFERLVMYLTGVSNIRDVMPAPAHRGQRGVLRNIGLQQPNASGHPDPESTGQATRTASHAQKVGLPSFLM